MNGAIVVGFDPATDNDGVNIAAPEGEPVRAAADGTVSYAGNELRGFGNLVILRHRGGWTTVYAHNQAVLVERGDRVRQGQVIARAGTRRGCGQLHFEVREHGQAVDPLRYLPAAPITPATPPSTADPCDGAASAS